VALPREERQTNEFNALENGLGKKCLIVFQGVSEWSPKLETRWLPMRVVSPGGVGCRALVEDKMLLRIRAVDMVADFLRS
jgi:hypothetical protein